jgi:DNA-binding IclR family transcriptional regulator
MDKTLVKGVQLLEHLLDAGRPTGVSELARLSGLNPSNVHRTLQTWAALGFVAQDPASGAYHCTLRLFEWGCRVADAFDVRRAAREPLARLARSTQETIHLSVLDGAEIVYLDKVDSAQPVRAYSQVGGRAPAHCVATGKALLAYAPASVLDSLPKPLPRPTSQTVRSLSALRTQLEQVHRVGYAVNRGEWRSDVSGLGAVIFDQYRNAIAAVGLSAPSARMDDARIASLGIALATAADEITRALGGGLRRRAA